MIERTNPPERFQLPGYSHVVVASGRYLVTTAGAVPLDAAGNLVSPGDRHAQARQTLENLALALEAIGATATSNFSELRACELRRNYLPRTPVNRVPHRK